MDAVSTFEIGRKAGDAMIARTPRSAGHRADASADVDARHAGRAERVER
jgi:hypothetical protein